MITIITRWEDQQMPKELERRMWRQLKGAFAVQDIIFADNDLDILSALKGSGDKKRVFLEPKAEQSVADIPDGDIVMVLGNTQTSNEHLALSDEEYAVKSPNPTDLYGINAAAIALAIRYGQ